MSLILEQGTKPNGVEVKTYTSERIWIRTKDAVIDMSIADFCEVVEYVMTNTNLEPHDPRIKLKDRISLLLTVGGFGGAGHRYSSGEHEAH